MTGNEDLLARAAHHGLRLEPGSVRHDDRLGERCAALMAAGPVNYGRYALATGRAEHRAAAQAQLSAA